MNAPLPKITETAFQAQVLELAELLGWHGMHVRRSKVRGDRWATATSLAGWPDLFLWHEHQRRTIAAELKTDTGRPTLEQTAVLTSLARAGVETHVWRPRDFDTVERCLRGADR